jgi:hypothetical protein
MKEEELLFGESLRRVLISYCPNPTRKGCPAPKIIRDLAFHKAAGQPGTFRRSPITLRDAPMCLESSHVPRGVQKQRRNRLLIGAALALVGVLTAVVASAGSAGPKEVEC